MPYNHINGSECFMNDMSYYILSSALTFCPTTPRAVSPSSDYRAVYATLISIFYFGKCTLSYTYFFKCHGFELRVT